MRIERYTPEKKATWDAMVESAVNQALIHRRDYMDYHAERFADYSLMAYDSHGRLVGMMPASRDGDCVRSHGGLTFGGLIVGAKHASAPVVGEVMESIVGYMAGDGVKTLHYSPIPWIYGDQPMQDDEYALLRMGAQIESVMLSSAMDLQAATHRDYNSRAALGRLERQGARVGESERWEEFYKMLTDCIGQRHDARPVHSLEELLMLKERMNGKIKLYTAENSDGEMLGGAVTYESRNVVHTQYMATSERGRGVDAMDAVVDAIGRSVAGGVRYLDLGTSTDPRNGRLNEGLARKKYDMGGRGVLVSRLIMRF